MKLSLVTCTADRPWAIARAEAQIARQTLQPDEWVIADDGLTPANLTQGQVHVQRTRGPDGALSLCHNLLAALAKVSGDLIVVIEDDDWYHPEYLETCVRRLQTTGATGDQLQRYYHVGQRRYLVMNNKGASLCQTSLRREHLPALVRAAEAAAADRQYGIDARFWASLPKGSYVLHEDLQVVGLKGLPGRQGLGLGHRPDHKRPWQDDPQGQKLRAWLGEDADIYLSLMVVQA